MIPYILITISSVYYGAIVHTQEFTTQAACEAAVRSVVNQADMMDKKWTRISAKCLPKAS